MSVEAVEPTDLLKKYAQSSEDLGPCVEVGARPPFIEFRRPAGRWVALPYGLMLGAEVEDEPRTSGKKSLVLKYRDCEVRVLGDRLEAVFSAIVEQRVTRLSAAEPKDAFLQTSQPSIRELAVSWKAQ